MKRILRWTGIVFGVLAIIIIVAGVILYFRGSEMIDKKWEIDVAELEIPDDEATIAEGERIFVTRGCGGCHGDDAGGEESFQIPMLASIYPSNLTSAGAGAYYKPADYARAILHGVAVDGHALIEMPAEQFQYMRQAEIVALIAYLQSLPAVENDLPETQIQVLGRVLAGLGGFPPPAAYKIDHSAVQENVATDDVSIENGEILASQMCVGCHQENLAGGALSYDPSVIVADITFHEDGLAGWTLEDFVTTIRTGANPEGEQLKDPMPWEQLALLTDEELESIYLYLKSVEPLPQGE